MLNASTCFDSTYEGLKRGGLSKSLPEFPGFDSTYEGLKLLVALVERAAREGFDSTYEGLKLGRDEHTARNVVVFRQYL